jgi:hypothetical protein
MPLTGNPVILLILRILVQTNTELRQLIGNPKILLILKILVQTNTKLNPILAKIKNHPNRHPQQRLSGDSISYFQPLIKDIFSITRFIGCP